jgi:hypothetical protein
LGSISGHRLGFILISKTINNVSRETLSQINIPARQIEEVLMNPDIFNMSLRKFLKQVGVTSQREIENAVRDALENGMLKGDERLPTRMTITIDRLGFTHVVEGEITLDKEQ